MIVVTACKQTHLQSTIFAAHKGFQFDSYVRRLLRD
jgi:hypothetical protein